MNQVFKLSPVSIVSCLATWLGISALLVTPAFAQVNGAGPSPSNLFDIVLNLPGDEAVVTGGNSESIGGVSGQTTQLNFSDGGVLGWAFTAHSGSEVNISGGAVGLFFTAHSGSEVNISGGTVGPFFTASNGSVVTISGGTGFDRFEAHPSSEVNISGGTVDGSFNAAFGSEVNFSGGTVVGVFHAYGFEEFRSVVNISGGTLFGGIEANSDSEVNISGGTVDGSIIANVGSEVNISGGTVVGVFHAYGFEEFRSVVNISGSEFSINGEELVTLVPAAAFTITDRDVTLSGLLADGEPFSFDLNSDSSLDGDFFDSDATVTVTLGSPVILGDTNLDGVVDFLDINPFLAVLFAATFQAEADCDENGVVDFLDITAFVDLLVAS